MAESDEIALKCDWCPKTGTAPAHYRHAGADLPHEGWHYVREAPDELEIAASLVCSDQCAEEHQAAVEEAIKAMSAAYESAHNYAIASRAVKIAAKIMYGEQSS